MSNLKLVVCEKRMVGIAVASVLNVKDNKTGYMQSGEYIVTWCLGHLLEPDPPESYDPKYEKRRMEDLPIIPEKLKYSAAKSENGEKERQLKIVTELMKRPDVDEIICATDAGREGELIFRLVYNHAKCRKPLKRLWVSSLEEKALKQGFENLRDGSEYDNLYRAAYCRQASDWTVGINFSRVFSLSHNAGLSVGRVQTPTLAMIVGREKEIADFVKESFYTVELDCGDFNASSKKMNDSQTAESIREVCSGKTAVIKSVENQEKSAAPPKLYDLTTLQREANRAHGFTAKQTLEYVQSLYEKKILTYPRTDSRYLTDDMEEKLPSLAEKIYEVLFAGKTDDESDLKVNAKQVIDNSKVSDHHAIIPTETAAESNIPGLPSGEKKIFDMVSLQLLRAVGDKHIYNETVVTVECEDNIFTAKGRTTVHNGWKSLKTDGENQETQASDEKTLPELTANQEFSNVTAKVNEGFTSPPKSFTEDTLLSAMENAGDFSEIPDAERKGLGTPATRCDIIERLVKKQYIVRQQAKKVTNILPTELGKKLIEVLPDTVKSAQMTAEWEHMLTRIAKGEVPESDFMNGITDFIRETVNGNSTVKNTGEFAAFYPPRERTEIGICPKCGGKVYENSKAFSCENTRAKTCKFTIWKENNKYFESRKIKVTAEIVSALIKDGKVKITGMYSDKTKKKYDGTVVLTYSDEGYVNFKLADWK